MPRIERIDASVMRVPLARPVRLATRSVTGRDWLIVKAEAGDGLQGLGFSFAGYEGGDIAATAVMQSLAPYVIGQESHDSALVWNRMFRQSQVQGRAGILMRALSAIDIAIWDLNARSLGLPLYRYLGAALGDPIPVCVGSGYYGKENGAEEIAILARRGYRAIKVKVGRLSARQEGNRLRSFRTAAGPEVELIADANSAWSDAVVAETYLHELEDARLAFIEDPFLAGDLSSYRRLRARSRIPVSTGEIFSSPHEFCVAIEADALDVVQVDATSCGGVTAFIKIAAYCELRSVPMETHWFPELHVHLAASAPACRRVEVFDDAEIVNFGKLVTSTAKLCTDFASPGNGPGHGIQLV